jgi:Type I phosphodiesterase / nucleotide pyrophosphatase
VTSAAGRQVPSSAEPTDLPTPPRYGSASLPDLLPSLLAGMGVAGEAATLALPPAARVVVLLIDGLGAEQLAVAEDAPFLTAHFDPTATLDAGFPATTPVSLTSLGSGVPPGVHGLTGFFMRRPEDGVLLNLLRLPPELGPRDMQPLPTAFERAVAAGVAVSRVGPRSFEGVGLTEYGLRGGDYLGADRIGERIAAVEQSVRRGDRSLVYAYYGDLDATGHRSGCRSVAWERELTHVDRIVEQLAGTLPDDCLLVVTADHGMVDVAPDARWDLATSPELDAGVEVLAGDPRAVHVHACPGAAADVLAAWSELLGANAWVVSRDVAIDQGWFGPTVAPRFRGRIGDVVAAMRTDVAVVDSRRMPSTILSLVGLHGSLTTAEQRVPLVVVPAVGRLWHNGRRG